MSLRGLGLWLIGQLVDELRLAKGRPRDTSDPPPAHRQPRRHRPAAAMARLAGNLIPRWLLLKQLACTAIVLLLGMPGRPVVAGSGRSRYCAPGRGSTFCLATRRSSLSLAVGASVGSALVDTSKTMGGGTST